MEKNILFKTHQHVITLILRILRIWIIPAIGISIIFYFLNWVISALIAFLFVFIIVFFYFHFFYSKSYFYITNEKLSINVRNWLFSQFNMSLHFDQIKDMAYSKNHLLHYIFNYWVLFIRSSAWSDWNFTVPDIPNIEEIYKKVSFMYSLEQSERNTLKEINENYLIEKRKLSESEIIEKNKEILLWIKWIKEVVLLSNEDKKFIFENEEDRNHWVYECIKRKITLVFTHDSEFRNADAPIVLKLWNKVIFPPVSFHEVKEKNVVSSSPWLEIHKYLSKKFSNLWEYDATVLVWFDV